MFECEKLRAELDTAKAEIKRLEGDLVPLMEECCRLKSDNAALLKALKDAVYCEACQGLKINSQEGCPYCEGTGIYFKHLPPASRALCEKHFKEE